jgi:hypothetical protein
MTTDVLVDTPRPNAAADRCVICYDENDKEQIHRYCKCLSTHRSCLVAWLSHASRAAGICTRESIKNTSCNICRFRYSRKLTKRVEDAIKRQGRLYDSESDFTLRVTETVFDLIVRVISSNIYLFALSYYVVVIAISSCLYNDDPMMVGAITKMIFVWATMALATYVHRIISRIPLPDNFEDVESYPFDYVIIVIFPALHVSMSIFIGHIMHQLSEPEDMCTDFSIYNKHSYRRFTVYAVGEIYATIALELVAYGSIIHRLYYRGRPATY